jgi:hypothetical protein
MGEQGTLHAGQVMEVETRQFILATRPMHDAVTAAGVTEASITDGSVVMVRLMCCGPPKSSLVNGYLNPNPQALPLKQGDFVEVRLGGQAAAQVNAVTRVLQHADQKDGACWWEPRNEDLWRRVVYCEWMQQEGWLQQEGLYMGWYKPVAAQSP